MMKLFVGLLILFVVCFQFCQQKAPDFQEQFQQQVTATYQHWVPFSCTVLASEGDESEFIASFQEFQNELRQQQILPTGPFYIEFFGIPERDVLQWKFYCPIAEGTMVKEPLVIQKWAWKTATVYSRPISFSTSSRLFQAVKEFLESRPTLWPGSIILQQEASEAVGTPKHHQWVLLLPTASYSQQLAE